MGKEVDNWCKRIPEIVLFNQSYQMFAQIVSFIVSTFQLESEMCSLLHSLQERQGCTVVRQEEVTKMTQGLEHMMYEKRLGTAFIQSYQEKRD